MAETTLTHGHQRGELRDDLRTGKLPLAIDFYRLPFSAAKESLEALQQAITAGYLHLERITPERFEKAKELQVVMAECGITEILTEDDHFLQVGMGSQKMP